MSEEDSNLKKRKASKRYPYVPLGKGAYNNQLFDVQLLNISKSGIQFACDAKIDVKAHVKLAWTDFDFSQFETMFLIAREVEDCKHEKFKHCYGAQYLDTSAEMREQLLSLIRHLKEQDLQQNRQQVEQLTPGNLFHIIDEGIDFLKNTIFLADKVPAHLKTFIEEIQEYETHSFPKDDEISKCIQQLTTHHFHFNLLLKATEVMAEGDDLQLLFLNYVQKEIDKSRQFETRVQVVTKDLSHEMISEEEKAASRKQISESMNRLFYTKQRLLKAVTEKFNDIESTSEEFDELLKKINREYEITLQSVENRKSNLETERPKKNLDSSKPKTHPLLSQKTRWKVYSVTVVVLLALKTAQILNQPDSPKTVFLKDLGVPAPVKSYNVSETRIDLELYEKRWEKLSHEEKKNIYQKLIVYLQAHSNTPVVALFSDQGKLIKIVYTSSVVTDDFVDQTKSVPDPTPTAQPAGTVSSN